jgi:hypothetical protein
MALSLVVTTRLHTLQLLVVSNIAFAEVEEKEVMSVYFHDVVLVHFVQL